MCAVSLTYPKWLYSAKNFPTPPLHSVFNLCVSHFRHFCGNTTPQPHGLQHWLWHANFAFTLLSPWCYGPLQCHVLSGLKSLQMQSLEMYISKTGFQTALKLTECVLLSHEDDELKSDFTVGKQGQWEDNIKIVVEKWCGVLTEGQLSINMDDVGNKCIYIFSWVIYDAVNC